MNVKNCSPYPYQGIKPGMEWGYGSSLISSRKEKYKPWRWCSALSSEKSVGCITSATESN